LSEVKPRAGPFGRMSWSSPRRTSTTRSDAGRHNRSLVRSGQRHGESGQTVWSSTTWAISRVAELRMQCGLQDGLHRRVRRGQPCVFLRCRLGTCATGRLPRSCGHARALPGEARCFINRNTVCSATAAKPSVEVYPGRDRALALVDKVKFGSAPQFGRLLYGKRGLS